MERIDIHVWRETLDDAPDCIEVVWSGTFEDFERLQREYADDEFVTVTYQERD